MNDCFNVHLTFCISRLRPKSLFEIPRMYTCNCLFGDASPDADINPAARALIIGRFSPRWPRYLINIHPAGEN